MNKRLFYILFGLPLIAYANGIHNSEQSNLILGLAMIIAIASLSSWLKKFDLPSVIGELLLGMLCTVFAHYQFNFFVNLVSSPSLALLAELGSILLLFEIGLESNLTELVKVGKHGVIVALLGVFLPFIIGTFLVAPYVFNTTDFKISLFLGATLAATSTGISIRVFQDLKILKNKACQIVLAASVIDDVLGLIILAFVTGLVISNSLDILNVSHILANVILFFSFAFLFGQNISPKIVRLFLKINKDDSLLTTLIIAFGLSLSYLASLIGLASIIGAFVAGLLLDELIFRSYSNPRTENKLLTEFSKGLKSRTYRGLSSEEQELINQQKKRLINLIRPLNYILVPIFFVYAGMQVDLIKVASLTTLYNGLILSLAAIIGKVFCGIFLPKTVNRWIVGFGMVPRGEVGLIFAMAGTQLGVFNDEVFAAILIMVIITSILPPIVLQKIARSI